MRYRIEYLRESTEEDSVCDVWVTNVLDLGAADAQAKSGEVGARASGANGYQIRDLLKDGEIVALETFDL